MVPRKLLALALFALLALTAGCSADGSLSMQPVDERGLAEQASNELSDDPQDRDAALVRAAIENGTATRVDERPPVDEPLPFRHDGRFYDVSYSEVGTERGYAVQVRIDFNASSVEGEVVEYGDLPAVDRRTLADTLERADRTEERLRPGYDEGVRDTYNESDAESSVFARTQEYDAVRYEGEVYPVDATTESETLTVYRYEAALVAESAEAYGATLRDEYAFELSGLSDAESDLLAEATNDTHYIEDSDNQAFASLVERFRSHETVTETEYDGRFVVRYDGQVYWATMSYGSYVEDDGGQANSGEETPPA